MSVSFLLCHIAPSCVRSNFYTGPLSQIAPKVLPPHSIHTGGSKIWSVTPRLLQLHQIACWRSPWRFRDAVGLMSTFADCDAIHQKRVCLSCRESLLSLTHKPRSPKPERWYHSAVEHIMDLLEWMFKLMMRKRALDSIPKRR